MLLLKRLVRALPLLLLWPVLMAIGFVALLLTDIFKKTLSGVRGSDVVSEPRTSESGGRVSAFSLRSSPLLQHYKSCGSTTGWRRVWSPSRHGFC